MEPNPTSSTPTQPGPGGSKAIPAALTLVVFIVVASADYVVQAGDTLNPIAAELGVSKADYRDQWDR